MNELQKTENKSFSLVPQNMEQAIGLATRFAKSGMVPKHYAGNPDAILVAWEYGGSLGLGLMQSLQGIAVINGMPCIWGDSLLAAVMASGQLESIDESVEGKCTVVRKGKNPATTTFTMADAKVAGLIGKTGPWTQYPKRMLQMRVRAFALRDNFPDILKGMQVAEEVQDFSDKFPHAIDASSTPSAPIPNVLAQQAAKEPTANNETVTDQETGEVTDQETGEITESSGFTTDEMNEILNTKLFQQIADLRQEKDLILKDKTKGTDALNTIDATINSGFKGKTLTEIKECRDFLLKLK